MSDFCMDGKNPICWLLAPFALLSGCKEDDAATGTDLDVDSDTDVDSDADVDTYVSTYTHPDTDLPVSFGRAQAAQFKPDIISDFYHNSRLWNMRTLSTIAAVASGMFLSGCGPSDQTLEDAIRSTPEAMNGTRADFKRVRLVRTGPSEKTEKSECIPVQVDVSYEALDNPRSQVPLPSQHCEGIADWNVCRSRNRMGDWGPWHNAIRGYRWKPFCDCYK